MMLDFILDVFAIMLAVVWFIGNWPVFRFLYSYLQSNQIKFITLAKSAMIQVSADKESTIDFRFRF